MLRESRRLHKRCYISTRLRVALLIALTIRSVVYADYHNVFEYRYTRAIVNLYGIATELREGLGLCGRK